MENPPRLPLILCVVVGIGALCASQFGLAGVLPAAAPGYVGLAALVLALVVWHLRPARAWPWLTIAGALCTVPNLFSLLGNGYPEGGWHLLVNAAAQPLLLVGLLAAATHVWCAGGRQAGAVLIGAVLVVPPLSTVVLPIAVTDSGTAVVVAGLVLVGLTVVTAGRAVSVPPAEVVAPGWRVTLAGVGAAVATGITIWWPAPNPLQLEQFNGVAGYLDEAGRHSLYTGIALLAVGLIAGAVAGIRVLVTGLAGGLVLGSASSLAVGTLVQVRLIDLPLTVPVLLAAGALAAGVLVARSQARELLGAGLLGAAVVGLLLLYLGNDSGRLPEDSDLVVLAIPLVAIFIAALPVFASLGSVLAPTGAAPAALAGVVTVIAGGITGIAQYFTFADMVTSLGARAAHPVIMVCLLVAAGLTVFVVRRWARS